MALTLGLNSALSGLLTNQRALDTISQNIVNANTVGYTKKSLTLESRVVAGVGAGVQTGTLNRAIDEGLQDSIRKQEGALGQLGVEQNYYPRIEDMFGKVGDANSLAHKLEDVHQAFDNLNAQPTDSAIQWKTVQSAINTTQTMNDLSTQIQGLRLDADQQIETVVNQANQLLDHINDLNQKIVRDTAIKADTADLEDKRDQDLTTLSGLMDIQYFRRDDNSMLVFTGTGSVLLDNKPRYLAHTGATITDTWMSHAGGQFGKLTIGDNPTDITGQVASGKLAGYIGMRDTTLVNLQAQVDELARGMQDAVNQVHNRGTTLPDVSSTYTGSRTFANQANVVQGMSMGGTQDTAIVLYDKDGTQVAATTLRSIMAGVNQPWAIDDRASNPASTTSVAAKMQSWLQAQNYNNSASAKVALDANGHFTINTGDPGFGLAFRDQVDGSPGAAAKDCTITFQTDISTGSTLPDQTIKGFSNFLGLNDFFTSAPRSIMDSAIQAKGATTLQARQLTLYDVTGQIGNSMNIPAGSSLQNIANQINANSVIYQSPLQVSNSVSLAASGAVIVRDPQGNMLSSFVLPSGTTNLSTIATGLNNALVTAKVVEDQGKYRLRLWSNTGQELTVETSAPELTSKRVQQFSASVVPEGSGERLRITQADDREFYAQAPTDPLGNSLLGDIGLEYASTRSAEKIQVRDTIQTSPVKIARGQVEFNADTSKYYLSAGDASNVTALANTMAGKITLRSAGEIFGGNFTVSEHAATSISLVAQHANDSKTSQTYQSSVNDSLKTQFSGTAGVNIDEEVTQMISYQQAYAASAKVISTLAQMLDQLVNIVK